MNNTVFHDAMKLSLPVPANTKSGTPVKVGSLIGVTVTAEGEGGNPAGFASVWRHGAYDLEVTGALPTIGTPVYITTAGALTATAGENTLFGYALDTKSAGAGTVRVALAQV